jgi:glutathionylspermidine synthase
MNSALRAETALPPAAFADVRRRAIFECCKWDPQVGDVAVLAPFPLVLPAPAWAFLCGCAEALYRETVAVEAALRVRHKLHAELGLPRAVRRVLRRMRPGTTHVCTPLRVMRFDFHPTPDGWCISEVNSDVPGGYVEASGFSALMATPWTQYQTAGDPVSMLAEAIERRVGRGARVALAHATAYVDDRSAMELLARRFQARGMKAALIAPDALDWRGGAACIDDQPVDFLLRFYPAEWLPNLPRRCAWPNFFGGTGTPQCNAATALLTQSKRWPLYFDELGIDLPTWRTLLPAVRPAREALRAADGDGWVLKPALGRVGECIRMAGVTPPKEASGIARAARWFPRQWIAQRRFETVPVDTPDGRAYPCIGVFVIDGVAAGAYGRIASRPLIDYRARDVAVLIEPAITVQPPARAEHHVAA